MIEAFTVITRQCPNGAVRTCAEQALDAVKAGKGNAKVLREQAFLVVTAMRGWRGERASQVSRSLNAFLERGASEAAG